MNIENELNKLRVPKHSRQGRKYSLLDRLGWLRINNRGKFWTMFPSLIGAPCKILNYDSLMVQKKGKDK